jgi:hypothetical protein
MDGVRAALRTKLLDRKFVGLYLLVFGGGVVARFASVARKRNQISHYTVPRKTSASPGKRTSGAHDGNRTHDLFLTKEVLYRLSYVGLRAIIAQKILVRLERETGLEPATPSLEGSRSTN